MSKLAKATLREVKWEGERLIEVTPKYEVTVQFNPETLSISYSTQKSGGDQRGGAAIQYSGPGTTKLSMDLWFDVTVLEGEEIGSRSDVQSLTDEVIYFIKPKKSNDGSQNPQYVPPGIRVVWGRFLFAGIMDSVTQKLEYFSEDGRPLRAMLSIDITGQIIKLTAPDVPISINSLAPGRVPLQQVQAREPLQKMLAKQGLEPELKEIAAANGIENLRLMSPGTFINTFRDIS